MTSPPTKAISRFPASDKLPAKKSKPLLLYSYFAAEVLTPFFAAFFIINGVFYIVKLLPFLDKVLELQIDFPDFVRASSYLLPTMMSYSIPMAAMLSIIIAFTKMNNQLEILALKTCGISLYKILPPVLIVAFFISLTTGYLSIVVQPASQSAVKQLFLHLTREKINKGIKEKQFTAAMGDMVIHVEEIDRKTNEWKNVWVSDMRDKKMPTITMAERGQMTTNAATMTMVVTLLNGSMHRTEGDKSQIVLFSDYLVEIPVTLPTGKEYIKGKGAMSMTQLRKAAHDAGVETRIGRDYLERYHNRIILPFGCLILSLLAIPFGLQSGPGRPAFGIPLGLGSFILYYVFYTVGKDMAVNSPLPVWLAMWMPNLIFLSLTLIGIYRVAAEMPLFPAPVNRRLLLIKQGIADLAGKVFQKGRRRRNP